MKISSRCFWFECRPIDRYEPRCSRGREDKTRHDTTRPGQTRSDQTRPDQTSLKLMTEVGLSRDLAFILMPFLSHFLDKQARLRQVECTFAANSAGARIICFSSILFFCWLPGPCTHSRPLSFPLFPRFCPATMQYEIRYLASPSARRHYVPPIAVPSASHPVI
jgi:hypothetical protein